MESFNLLINVKKSGIFCIKGHKLLEQTKSNELKDIPIVTSYRYLGIDINNYGSIESYIVRIK